MENKKLTAAIEKWHSIQPLSEDDRSRLSRRFTIDFNYNSNHIEGNTLTYGQTEILLLFGKVIGEADVKDVQDMAASNVALKMASDEADFRDVPLTQNFIRTLHNVQRVEILPYHTLGIHKYEDLGIPYPLTGVASPTAERIANAKAILECDSYTGWKQAL